ncbi:hypothetical protein M3Y99_01485800 [Aphelenchoides fujianensis]|nr:hypothetical protein M3Y99_01485800 [Aphelenchoides fujianensis]
MVTADVTKKPQIRTANVRNALNRFLLIDATRTAGKKGATRFLRLAAVSRAQLAAVRRSARGLRFVLGRPGWRAKMDVGFGAPTVEFAVSPPEMVAIAKLLPVHVEFGFDVRWEATVDSELFERIGKFVNGLSFHHYSVFHIFYQFIKAVTTRNQLKELECSWSYLEHFRPLQLDRFVMQGMQVDYDELARHKIRRLDASMDEICRVFPDDRVLSASITSLGLVHHHDLFTASPARIDRFCRRFTALEELHIMGNFPTKNQDVVAHLKAVWSKCLKIRDRLDVPGLQRVFFTTERPTSFEIPQPSPDWLERVQAATPWNKATFVVASSGKRVRMFLKHNEPRGPTPTFVRFQADFSWTKW